jgi:hypothetical protein
MKMLIFALLTAAAYAAPLEPAATGKMQCYMPDTARKTCASLALYKQNADGTYANTAIILLNKSPAVVMETITPVRIVSGAVCGSIRAEDIAAGKLTVNGHILTPEQAAPALAQISTAMAGIIGHDICTTYTDSGQGLIAKSTIDGAAQPAMDQPVKWVAPEDGYTVAP